MEKRGRRGDHIGAVDAAEFDDVGQGWQRIDQHVTREERRAREFGKDGLGPAARDEVAVLVGVAATLTARVEVKLLPRFAPAGLADVAATA